MDFSQGAQETLACADNGYNDVVWDPFAFDSGYGCCSFHLHPLLGAKSVYSGYFCLLP